MRLAALLLLVLTLTACTGSRRHAPDTAPQGAQMGVYRARVESPSSETSRFRLLLYAELPDRIHAEVLSPVGTTELIVDGGAGRLSVAVPREKVAYVGSAEAHTLEPVLGLSLTLGQLVGALLGESVDLAGHRFSREPEAGGGLPRELEIEGGGHKLTLRLKRMEPLRVSTATLGNGEPPPGLEQLPLDSLRPVDLQDDPAAGDPR